MAHLIDKYFVFVRYLTGCYPLAGLVWKIQVWNLSQKTPCTSFQHSLTHHSLFTVIKWRPTFLRICSWSKVVCHCLSQKNVSAGELNERVGIFLLTWAVTANHGLLWHSGQDVCSKLNWAGATVARFLLLFRIKFNRVMLLLIDYSFWWTLRVPSIAQILAEKLGAWYSSETSTVSCIWHQKREPVPFLLIRQHKANWWPYPRHGQRISDVPPFHGNSRNPSVQKVSSHPVS